MSLSDINWHPGFEPCLFVFHSRYCWCAEHENFKGVLWHIIGAIILPNTMCIVRFAWRCGEAEFEEDVDSSFNDSMLRKCVSHPFSMVWFMFSIMVLWANGLVWLKMRNLTEKTALTRVENVIVKYFGCKRWREKLHAIFWALTELSSRVFLLTTILPTARILSVLWWWRNVGLVQIISLFKVCKV